MLTMYNPCPKAITFGKQARNVFRGAGGGGEGGHTGANRSFKFK